MTTYRTARAAVAVAVLSIGFALPAFSAGAFETEDGAARQEADGIAAARLGGALSAGVAAEN